MNYARLVNQARLVDQLVQRISGRQTEINLKGRKAMIMGVFFGILIISMEFKQFVCLLLAKIYGLCCYHCLIQDLSFNLVFKHIYFLLLQMIL